MRLLLVICAIAIIAIASVQALDTNAANWIRVPGGATIHKSCLHEVPSGTVIDASNTPPCLEIAPPNAGVQLYAIDTHWTTTNVSMRTFDAGWTVPGDPPTNDGQVNFFWPGFKSNQPTMGLPVVQPVLQWESDGWAIRSWYVYGDVGDAYVSDPIPLNAGDIIGSSMKFDAAAKLWTISCWNVKTQQNTTLQVSKATTHNTDFKVAMLVLETIMPPNECDLLPASPSSITFTGIKVNGVAAVPWVPRTGSNDCGQKVAKMAGDQVTFTWTN